MIYQEHIIAYSKNSTIRRESSSGGFCKSFLIYLIENKVVDYTILTRMKDNTTSPESIITNDRNKILTRPNSIYEYHNQLEILSEINADKQYSFIGLPCFVRFIRNQQLKNNKYKNIYPLISILCNQAPVPLFKQKILEDNNIDINEVIDINYRYGDYPGSIYVMMRNNKNINLGLLKTAWGKYNDPNYCYAPPCCLNCELYESKFADIVVGDPWLTKYEKDTKGWTKIIVQNADCMNLIRDCAAKNYIYIEKLDNTILAYKKTKIFKQDNNKRCK